jgi:protein FAM32A
VIAFFDLSSRTLQETIMGDAYSNVNLGKLKLKGKALPTKDKKKKRKRRDRKEEEISVASIPTSSSKTEDYEDTYPDIPTLEEEGVRKLEDTMTEAEKKFEEAQQKRERKRIATMASRSHREKIDDFNKHLDSLSQHFDIPKVS